LTPLHDLAQSSTPDPRRRATPRSPTNGPKEYQAQRSGKEGRANPSGEEAGPVRFRQEGRTHAQPSNVDRPTQQPSARKAQPTTKRRTEEAIHASAYPPKQSGAL